MSKPELYSERFMIRITPALMAKLKAKAKAKGINASEMVRRLVLNYIEGIGDVA